MMFLRSISSALRTNLVLSALSLCFYISVIEEFIYTARSVFSLSIDFKMLDKELSHSSCFFRSWSTWKATFLTPSFEKSLKDLWRHSLFKDTLSAFALSSV